MRPAASQVFLRGPLEASGDFEGAWLTCGPLPVALSSEAKAIAFVTRKAMKTDSLEMNMAHYQNRMDNFNNQFWIIVTSKT